MQALLAGRVFEEVVVGVGFAPPGVEPDLIDAPNLLAFAGLPPVRVPALPVIAHVAEKVHAYTRRYGPAGAPSSRPKDLVDLVLLAAHEPFVAGELRAALEATLATRDTHPLPAELPAPPGEWARSYRALAEQVGIGADLHGGYEHVRAFLDPVLRGDVRGVERWGEATDGWS